MNVQLQSSMGNRIISGREPADHLLQDLVGFPCHNRAKPPSAAPSLLWLRQAALHCGRHLRDNLVQISGAALKNIPWSNCDGFRFQKPKVQGVTMGNVLAWWHSFKILCIQQGAERGCIFRLGICLLVLSGGFGLRPFWRHGRLPNGHRPLQPGKILIQLINHWVTGWILPLTLLQKFWLISA